jgi:hypothetical protein
MDELGKRREEKELAEFGFVLDKESGLFFDPVMQDYVDAFDANARITARVNLVMEGERIIGVDGKDYT